MPIRKLHTRFARPGKVGGADPLFAYDPYMVYRLTSTIEDAIFPNKIGS